MLFTRTVSWCVATTSPSCQVSRPDTVLLSMGHHDCDTQTIPKNPVHPCRAIGNHEPTLRSSKSRGEGPTIGPGRRVGKRGAVPRRYKLPMPSRPIHPRSEDSSCNHHHKRLLRTWHGDRSVPAVYRQRPLPNLCPVWTTSSHNGCRQSTSHAAAYETRPSSSASADRPPQVSKNPKPQAKCEVPARPKVRETLA